MPEVSIIIPTLDRYVDLQRTLRDLERQSYQDYELLVIDQSEHRKEALVRSWNSRLRYFASSQKSASAGRNLGIRMAKGSILLFIDDDVIIDDPDFLKKHVRHYVDPDVPGVVVKWACRSKAATDNFSESGSRFRIVIPMLRIHAFKERGDRRKINIPGSIVHGVYSVPTEAQNTTFAVQYTVPGVRAFETEGRLWILGVGVLAVVDPIRVG